MSLALQYERWMQTRADTVYYIALMFVTRYSLQGSSLCKPKILSRIYKPVKCIINNHLIRNQECLPLSAMI